MNSFLTDLRGLNRQNLTVLLYVSEHKDKTEKLYHKLQESWLPFISLYSEILFKTHYPFYIEFAGVFIVSCSWDLLPVPVSCVLLPITSDRAMIGKTGTQNNMTAFLSFVATICVHGNVVWIIVSLTESGGPPSPPSLPPASLSAIDCSVSEFTINMICGIFLP